jgi:calcium-binding protein CML
MYVVYLRFAFYSLVRQWKRKTDGMTEAAIKTKFHLADVNGDGRLNPKEFKKLLKTFGMEIAPADVEILIERFDVDNDGDIDLHEFRAFIESEQKNLFETSAAVASKSALLPPPKSTSYRSGAREGGYADDSGIGMARPRTAGASRASQSVASSRELPPRRPASAPRSRLNATAPGVIESSPNRRYGTGSLDRSVGFDVDEEPSGPEKISHKTYPRQGDHRQLSTIEETTGEFADTLGSDRVGMTVAEMPAMAKSSGAAGSALEEDVDVLWVARMLQAQAEVESRIGKRYYS